MKNPIINKLIFVVVISILFIYLQGELTKSGLRAIKNVSTSSTLAIFGLVLITFLYDIFHLRFLHNLATISKSVTLFCITTYVISIIYSLIYPFGSRNIYGALLIPLTAFWFFYIFSTKHEDMKFFTLVMSVLVLGLIYTYFQVYNIRQIHFKKESVINSSYFAMFMLPFLLCGKNKVFKIASIAIVTLVVFSSFKRSGTIAVLTAILAFILVEFVLIQRKKTWRVILLLIGISLVVFYIGFSDSFSDNYSDSYLIKRLESISKDKGSGRVKVWVTTISMIQESNVFQLIFGHGYNSVVKDSPLKLSAHNDFLEVLYDFGLIVLGIYITIYIQLVKIIKKLIKKKSEYAAPLTVSFVLFSISSLFSHIVIYPYYFIMFTMFWGFVLGKVRNKPYTIKTNN